MDAVVEPSPEQAPAPRPASPVRAEPEPFYQSAHCSVTIRLFKTRRRTYQISRIEKTEIRRPLLPILCPLGLALVLLALFWRSYLFDGEAYAAYGVGIALSWIAFSFGILVVQSKALEETAMYGSVRTLRGVRAAIDQAIEESEAANPHLGFYR